MLSFITGFRKWTLALLYLAVAIVLLSLDVIPKDDWLKHVSSVVIAFFATNVGEHLIKIGKDMAAKWKK